MRALAGEIYKQDHDDAVAEEVEAYRNALAEATEHHLGEGASEKIAELEGDVSDGYFSPRPKALKIRIDAYPRYAWTAAPTPSRDDRSISRSLLRSVSP